ncbi:MAG TPA: lysylphosphatidylglycerol synthase domain-containing protein [Stellaceae bacterium]|jgi:putative membrane protein
MKPASLAAAAIGIAVVGGLLIHFGAGAVLHSLLAVGWAGFATVCLIQAALVAVMGLAWWALLPGTNPWPAIWARLVRDSASEVLPLSQVGGYVAGARAIANAGVSGSAAAASTIVDVTLEFLAQIAYTAIALSWLLHLDPKARVAAPVAVGLAIGASLAAGFVFAQRHGFGLLDRLAGALGRGWAERTAAGAATLHAAIAAIYARPAGLAASFAVHLICWLASAAEIWLALRFIGVPLHLGAVLVIESLVYAIRSVAFAVPNAVGVQEGAYVLLGASFGLTPEAALALSLLKRGRDFAIGLPALAVWQLVEAGRLWRGTDRAGDAAQKRNPGRHDRGSIPCTQR